MPIYREMILRGVKMKELLHQPRETWYGEIEDLEQEVIRNTIGELERLLTPKHQQAFSLMSRMSHSTCETDQPATALRLPDGSSLALSVRGSPFCAIVFNLPRIGVHNTASCPTPSTWTWSPNEQPPGNRVPLFCGRGRA